ncbi:MAG: PspA/IM30 family protein [Gammaproteobacteria bacterium]|nr:PspA/IM30 family protein [Gammaproteobacteria bacterium]
MTFFKRLTATLTANIDQAISQIENHDAVVEAALQETRDAAARLKVQLARVRNEIAALRNQAERLRAEADTWRERARRTAGEDEQRALQCLRRRAECLAQSQHIETRLAQQLDLEVSLGRDLERIMARIASINQRREQLRGRELSARGTTALAALEGDTGLDVERVLERWEVEVTRSEIGRDAPLADVDRLAEDFERDERDRELRAELARLLNEKEG